MSIIARIRANYAKRRAQLAQAEAHRRLLMQAYHLEWELDCAIAEKRRQRLSRPARNEAKRFAHAAPKLAQLRREIAMQQVEF